ncbi:MAG: hydroxymethylbilane synthase [Planctomycetota bacterium]
MIRIATRGSDLALTQSKLVKSHLAQLTSEVIELVVIKTQGDREQTKSFREMEGRGFFTKEIEAALLADQADLAVHSLKDLPTTVPEGLMVVPVLAREDPREVLLMRRAAADEQLPLGLKRLARVGTSAVRRQAQLRSLRPDLELLELRGNVPTRVQKLIRGDYDAILIARAGLERLQLDTTAVIRRELPADELVPAPGQGMLAIELRAADRQLLDLVQKLVIEEDRHTVDAERALLTLFEGGCGLPLGAFARRTSAGYEMVATLGPRPLPGPDLPVEVVRVRVCDADWRELAPRAFEELLSKDYCRTATDQPFPLAHKCIVLTGTPRHVQELGKELMQRGASVVVHATVQPVADPDQDQLERVMQDLRSVDWVLFRSVTAVELFAPMLLETGEFRGRIGAIGAATKNALIERGFSVDIEPQDAVSEGLVKAFLDRGVRAPSHILLPGPHAGRTVLRDALVAHGYRVTELKLYRLQRTQAEQPLPDRVDAIVFSSPSAVSAFLDEQAIPAGALVVTIGPVTSDALRSRGLAVHREAARHDTQGIIEALVG